MSVALTTAGGVEDGPRRLTTTAGGRERLRDASGPTAAVVGVRGGTGTLYG